MQTERKKIIINAVNEYYDRYRRIPSVRELSQFTGIATTSLHRYLKELNESGEIEYNGRKSICTERINMECEHSSAPVLGYVRCGEGEEESQEIIEYIKLPESLIGKGEFFVLIAKGESMVDAGIYPGDYVVIKKQERADIGDIVVALYDGVNNLKKLGYDSKSGKYVLISCNEDKSTYADIHVDNLQIQGVAVCLMHRLKRRV